MTSRHMSSDPGWLCAITAAAATAALAPAAEAVNLPKSRYTAITLAACVEQSASLDGRAWRCEGLPRQPVYIAERDGRYYLSIGAEPDKRRAAAQTLGAVNTIFAGASNRMTIEWRIRRIETRDEPYATIVRYFTREASGKPAPRRGEVLIVTKVGAVDSCQIARIDALANPEAISLARSAADELAASFDCRAEPRIVGATGKSPM